MDQTLNPAGPATDAGALPQAGQSSRPADWGSPTAPFGAPPPAGDPAPPPWQTEERPWSAPEPSGPPGAPSWPAPLPGTSPLPYEPPGEAARRRTGRLTPVFVAALLGAVLGVGSTLVVADRAGVGGLGGGEVRVTAPVPNGGNQKLDGVAAVAAAVSPSIVRIDTSVRGFLGNQSGTGSGVIYRADGYILTNAHVVEGATSVEVTLASGDTLQGRVVGTAAPIDDIAVVKVNRDNLPAATFGSVLNTHVGDTAIAIGSPFGLSGTVTAGIVSAIRANLSLGGQQFVDVIQTDAPINPGNSGGALVNAKGEVIGINTAIVGGEGNVGIGFAIPIDIARHEADDIIKIGRATRAFLGVEPASVPGRNGARIQSVVPGGPAEKAGIRPGDVIVEIEGVTIRSAEELVATVARYRVGQAISVTFERDGRRQTVKAALTDRPQ